jgi:hypothetical protein
MRGAWTDDRIRPSLRIPPQLRGQAHIPLLSDSSLLLRELLSHRIRPELTKLQAIATIYIVVFSAIHFYLLCHHDHVSFGRALSESPGAAVSFLLGVLVLPATLFLIFYHVRVGLYRHLPPKTS